MEEILKTTILDQAPGAQGFDPAQEAAWIVASQQGDTPAFNRLVLQWEKPIYNLALRMLQDPDEAAEATQDVFLSAYKSIGRFRQESRFSTWLYRIAANRCITRLRQRPRGVHYSIDSDPEAVATQVGKMARQSHHAEIIQRDASHQVRRILGEIDADQRIVVELKFFQELTFEEISTITQVPLSTVKSRLYKGLEVLKSRLGRSRTSSGRPSQ